MNRVRIKKRILYLALSAWLCLSTTNGQDWVSPSILVARPNYCSLSPGSIFDSELQTEREILRLLRDDILAEEDTDNLAGRQLFLEDLYQSLYDGIWTQVAYIKIQNFKEFNTIGAEQYFGNYLGDFIISETGKALKGWLADLEEKRIYARVYHKGPGFFILFQSGPGTRHGIEMDWGIRSLLADEELKREIIRNTKRRLEEIDELKMPRLPRDPITKEVPELSPWEERIGQVREGDLHFYAGVTGMNLISGVREKVDRVAYIYDAVKRLDTQAQSAAKFSQLFNDERFLQIYQNCKGQSSDTIASVWREYLKSGPESFQASLAKSQVASRTQVSGWESAMDELVDLLHKEFGIGNIFEEFYLDLEVEVSGYPFYRELFRDYQRAIERMDLTEAKRIREKIFEKAFLYRGRYFNPKTDGTVIIGKGALALTMHYFIQNSPEEGLDRVFLIGGDEVVRCIWDGEKETLIPGDIPYMGLYNRQWGHELGDWVKDNTLRIFAQAPDPASVPSAVLNFF